MGFMSRKGKMQRDNKRVREKKEEVKVTKTLEERKIIAN